MDEPRIGQPVISDHGTGVVTAIEAGHADTDIHRYRITANSSHCWRYLDELLLLHEPARR